jgi:hypothetical protein
MTHPRYPQNPSVRVDQPQALPTSPGQPGLPVSGWTRFWFTPMAPTGLHVLRVLTGLLCLLWLLPLAGSIDGFLSPQGFFDAQAEREVKQLTRQQDVMMATWGIQYLAGDNHQALAAIYWGAVAVIALFTLGIATRITAVLTWVIFVSFTASPSMEYEADAFLAIFTFYLMVGYLFLGLMHGGLSPLERVLGSWRSTVVGPAIPGGQQPASVAANVAVRLLQVHVALVMVVSGLHKLQFGDWWQGTAFWYLLYPAGQATLATAREHRIDSQSFLFVISFGAYAVLAWQLLFPLFAWRRQWTSDPDDGDATLAQKIGGWLLGPRTILLGGALLGCLGVMFLYQLPLMGPALVIACLSYLRPEEWKKIFTLVGRAPGLHWLAPAPAAAAASAKPWSRQPEGGRENLVTAGRN